MRQGERCAACGDAICGVSYRFKNKTYCRDCYKKLVDAAKKAEDDMAKAISYACKLYSVMELSGSASSAMWKYASLGMTAEDIVDTLEYYYKAKGNPVGKPEDMWWVLRDNANDAKKHDKRMKELEAEAKASEDPTPPVVVTIKEPQPNQPEYDYDLSNMTCRPK